jgi:hemolysin III
MHAAGAPIALEGERVSQHEGQDGYTPREEFAHALSHGIGFIAAAVGLVALIYASSTRGTSSHVIGVSIFGSTLLLLYGASTLYHAMPESPAKDVLQKLDHVAIYLLIAGTYTPFLLVKVHGPSGWILLTLIWTLAVVGIALELIRNSPTRRTSVALYLGMGWLAVFALEPLIQTLEPSGLILLVLGGLTYSVGVIFYKWNRLPYNHAVWHGFVLGGSAFHFASILGFVIP